MARYLRVGASILLAVALTVTASPSATAKPGVDEAAPAPDGAEVTRPANDNFGRAITIPRPGRFHGNNLGGTRQPYEPPHANQNPGGHSVWWVWTPAYTRNVIITTRGSDFDTMLGIYRGGTIRTLRRIASNDDTNGLHSRVDFRAYAGNRYRIAVDGFRYGGQTAQTASAGRIVLNVVNA